MKKNDLLKIAVIIAFIALVLNNVGQDAYKGFVDGYQGVRNEKAGNTGRLAAITINGNSLGLTAQQLKLANLPQLEDMKVEGWLRADDSTIPMYVNALNYILIIVFLYLAISTINRIYKVVNAIGNNTGFEQPTVRHLKLIGYYFLALFVVVALLNKLFMLQNTIMAGPKLHLVDDADLPFGLLLAGFLVLLIAAAFEQGMKLNDEQKLTI